jgi:hypothetical protein
MAERILATVEIEEMESGFYYVVEGKPPVGPFVDEPAATEAAIKFLQGAMTRLAEQFITGGKS